MFAHGPPCSPILGPVPSRAPDNWGTPAPQTPWWAMGLMAARGPMGSWGSGPTGCLGGGSPPVVRGVSPLGPLGRHGPQVPHTEGQGMPKVAHEEHHVAVSILYLRSQRLLNGSPRHLLSWLLRLPALFGPKSAFGGGKNRPCEAMSHCNHQGLEIPALWGHRGPKGPQALAWTGQKSSKNVKNIKKCSKQVQVAPFVLILGENVPTGSGKPLECPLGPQGPPGGPGGPKGAQGAQGGPAPSPP